jgi:hypothetical protein
MVNVISRGSEVGSPKKSKFMTWHNWRYGKVATSSPSALAAMNTPYTKASVTEKLLQVFIDEYSERWRSAARSHTRTTPPDFIASPLHCLVMGELATPNDFKPHANLTAILR